MHIPGGSPIQTSFAPNAKGDPRAEVDLKQMYGRKARMLRKRFDRMGYKDGDPRRTVQVAPKFFDVAKKIGLTHIEGLRITL